MTPDLECETRQRLEGADPVPLALALAQLSGDLSVLDAIEPYVRGPWDYSQSIPDDMKSGIRDRVAQEIARIRAGGEAALVQPDIATLRRMMSVAVGEPVADEYVPMVLEQMSVASCSGASEDRAATSDQDAERPSFHVAIIGAGASGICAGIRLQRMGISYTVFEKNDHIGGTWYENRYPGCAVDTPNHFYQYSFEPNDEWPNYYSRQPSILEYLTRCVDKYDLRRNIRFRHEVEAAEYDAARRIWTITACGPEGEIERQEARAVICAVGQLNRPAIPEVPGMDDFAGPKIHSAAWPDDGLDLHGKRVALVGTGASAVQVGPAIVDEVAELKVLQRSGAWVARNPNVNRAVSSEKMWALKNVPFYAQWYRFQLFWGFADGLFPALRIDPGWHGDGKSINAENERVRQAMLRHIRRELAGREDLLDKVIPDYPPFGKRVLADSGWYRMLKREHVELISSPIERLEPNGIILRDGRRVPVDAIIFATGFQAGRMLWPMHITGRTGRSIREIWGDDDPRAYLGIVVPEFPNLFIMYGPNTNLGHGGSAIFLAECQMRYIEKTLRLMIENDLSSIEIRRDVHDAYNADIDARLRKLVWSHPTVTTWYKNAHGRIITNQPWRLVDYWRLTHEPDLAEFVTERG